MAHPYFNQAKSTHKAKTGSIGKGGNLVIPIMRAVAENSSKKIATSSSHQQHKDQSSADGMKRGGHVGKPKHHKPKIPMVVPEATANPPLPDPSLAAAGAGSSPAPAPIPPAGPPQPPMKRGGRLPKQVGGADNGPSRIKLAKLYAKKNK